MITQHAPRLMIAAAGSGSGKTTISCGLMQALINRGLAVQACKVGPDYIDPMFHRQVIGAPSRNLDAFFATENQIRELVAKGAETAEITVIEGVMGYYDGIALGERASAYDVARITNTPAILIVDARGKALSVAAEVAGFAHFRTPSQVAGVVFNRASASYYERLKALVESETGIPVLGYVPVLEDAALESRHLGLVTAGEVADLQQRVDVVARTLAETIEIDALVDLAQGAPAVSFEPSKLPAPAGSAPTIAVAYDDAFNFYYDDTFDALQQMGARIVRFSPLADTCLPASACGLWLGGGYPELHACTLSANEEMRTSIRKAVASGMPTIAECGGFMYLHEQLQDEAGEFWPMVGAVPGRSFKTERLGRFGYCTITAQADTLLAPAGHSLPAHEFHYWDSDHPGESFHAAKPQSNRSWDCVVASESLHAGYPHLYLYSQPRTLARFLDACSAYGSTHGSCTAPAPASEQDTR